MKNSFRIAEISYVASKWGDTYDFEYSGQHFEVRKFGVDYDLGHAKEQIKSLRSEVDSISLSSFPETIRYRNRSFTHRQYLEILKYPSSVPICDGSAFREILLIDGINRAIEKNKINPKKGIFFPVSLLYLEVIKELLVNHQDNLLFGDPFFVANLPYMSKPREFGPLIYGFFHMANLRDMKLNVPRYKRKFNNLTKKTILEPARKCQYILASLPTLLMFENPGELIEGKDLIIPYLIPGPLEEVLKYKPNKVIKLFPESFKVNPHMSFSVLESTLRLVNNITENLDLFEWEKLIGKEFKLNEQTKSHVALNRPSSQQGISKKFNQIKKYLGQQQKPIDFAFVVHALSQRDLARVPGLGFLKNSSPTINNFVESAASYAPGVVYGRINNIISESTGREVNGIIYGLFSTPKAMKSAPPEVIYNKIERLCKLAADDGAKIIGLGAYTKVVGDSGYTINRNSPIPVTTGNSLSASATLWSARDALIKLGFVKLNPDSGKLKAKAMIIGATGSIGRVSAKLLALSFDQVVIVAPRIEKLKMLKIELEKDFPNSEVIVSTDANEHASSCDLLVTATSAFDQKIVNVEQLMPGSVVCDCSRPLDFTPEDAQRRPDVLIIESGELVLPGPYSMTCDLGLPGRTVYACLAETALLALEKRYESFTLGRDIQWEKVKEIYRLCLKHGVKLADIQSHTGTVTDFEIEVIRQNALKFRKVEGLNNVQ